MRWLKLFLGAWNRRDLVFVALVLIAVIAYTVLSYSRSQPVSIPGVVTLGVLPLLVLRLFKLARRTPPTPRVKHVVSMSLIEIVNEFIYTGYRVEAMTENTVVLVRFSIRHLVVSTFLVAPLWIVVIFLSFDSPKALAPTTVLLPLLSLFVVYMYTIAGYGYDRIAFHQQFKDGPSTCVTFINSFLPSRVRAAVKSTSDHG